MEHYVTLFDSAFLPQGLTLYQSLCRHAGPCTLWVLCMDSDCYSQLTTLALPGIRLLALEDCETSELLAVKGERTQAEYCWTLTPFCFRFVFDAAPEILRLTYLDADLWFRKPPAAIFKEFDDVGKNVLITDHGYAPEHDQSATSGQYCVQFVTFLRGRADVVRESWEQQCLDWCFARFENGKFGDQKYLDDWPEKFPDLVHVLQDQERALGPWNATRYPYGRAVFWHMHGLRLVGFNAKCFWTDIGPYAIPDVTMRYVYHCYLECMRVTLTRLQAAGFQPAVQKKSLSSRRRLLLRLGVRDRRVFPTPMGKAEWKIF